MDCFKILFYAPMILSELDNLDKETTYGPILSIR